MNFEEVDMSAELEAKNVEYENAHKKDIKISVVSHDVKISKYDPTKCAHCGNPSPQPYQGYSMKRVKWPLITAVKCSKCGGVHRTEKSYGHSGATIETPEPTLEEKEARQLGKPSYCCNAPYIEDFVYYKQVICKACNGQYFGAHSPWTNKELPKEGEV